MRQFIASIVATILAFTILVGTCFAGTAASVAP